MWGNVPMAAINYQKQIIQTLKGETPEFADTTYERLDWSGVEAVLNLYGRTSGPDRDAMIQAMGRIIEEAAQPPELLAQVLLIAASLDIAQIEPAVNKLAATALATEEPVKSAVMNYLAFRSIYTKVYESTLLAGV